MKEVDPKNTNRAEAFELWMSSPISFQFHHVQMDGGYASNFLERLQDEI